MAAIVRKTLGAPNAIREALRPLAGRIARAFLYGSFAAGTDQPGSDIDLLVIGAGARNQPKALPAGRVGALGSE